MAGQRFPHGTAGPRPPGTGRAEAAGPSGSGEPGRGARGEHCPGAGAFSSAELMSGWASYLYSLRGTVAPSPPRGSSLRCHYFCVSQHPCGSVLYFHSAPTAQCLWSHSSSALPHTKVSLKAHVQQSSHCPMLITNPSRVGYSFFFCGKVPGLALLRAILRVRCPHQTCPQP